ncbi:MAG: DUF1501 domain-containing protein, partial [Pseudomonadota bacterium]
MRRRQFLNVSGTALAAAAARNLCIPVTTLAATESLAASGEDYRALVCVFLFGGLDNYDTVIPYDAASHSRWAQIRGPLLGRYPVPRTTANLLPLTTPARFGSRRFALPPEMPGLHALYQQGNAAVVGNVGPLVQSVDSTQFASGAAALPARLFSHNDQQSTWMSGGTEGAQFGWAGQIHDALLQAGVASPNIFSAVTMSAGELLITGAETSPYHLVGGTALEPTLLQAGVESRPIEDVPYLGADTVSVAGLPPELVEFFRASSSAHEGLLEQDLDQLLRASVEANGRFKTAVASAGTVAGFPTDPFGLQLRSVFEVMQARSTLGARRQLFVVTMGGYDTHSDQPAALPELQARLDAGISAFYAVCQGAGLDQCVTLFTASDFGRTLAVNGDGTDHGWAGHHFVVG